MGYRLVPYLIDLKSLQQVISFNQLDVIREIRSQTNDGQFRGINIQFLDALKEIVAGEISNPDTGHQYGYALQILCEHLGERIDSERWTNVRWKTIERTGLNAIIGKGCPVVLPPIPDFPTIGHLPRREINRLKRKSAWRTEMDPSISQLLTEYDSWLNAAIQRDCDLVFFYY